MIPITAEAWENTIRPELRGMARAVYAPAGFVRSTETTLTLSVPNAVHRAKCEEQRAVVEAALAKFAGGPVAVELVDGDGGGSSGGAGADGGAATAATRSEGGGGSGSGAASQTPSSAPSAPQASTAPGQDRGGMDPSESSSPRQRGLAAAAASATREFADDQPVPAFELPDDDDVDLDELVDAPPESVKSPIDRLAEAFPGSELIEEAG